MSQELGRLAQQGITGDVAGTDTVFFIGQNEVPPERRKDTTYARIVTEIREGKDDPNRVHIMVGGNLVEYHGDCGTPTANLITVKMMINSVISTGNTTFMTLDIVLTSQHTHEEIWISKITPE